MDKLDPAEYVLTTVDSKLLVGINFNFFSQYFVISCLAVLPSAFTDLTLDCPPSAEF